MKLSMTNWTEMRHANIPCRRCWIEYTHDMQSSLTNADSMIWLSGCVGITLLHSTMKGHQSTVVKITIQCKTNVSILHIWYNDCDTIEKLVVLSVKTCWLPCPPVYEAIANLGPFSLKDLVKELMGGIIHMGRVLYVKPVAMILRKKSKASTDVETGMSCFCEPQE